MALSRIDTTNMIEDVPQSKIDNNINFRNIIINGGMDLAQRGTSTSSITSSGYNTADRFKVTVSNMGTWTQTQSTEVPTGQGFAKSLKMDCTTADASPSAGDFLIIEQQVEGQNLQYLKKGTSSAESVTLSFWVKSNKTGTYIFELVDNDNSRAISKSYTISSADTWEKKTITYAGDTSGAFDNDNAGSLRLFFWLGGGTNYTSGTLNTSWGTRVDTNAAVGQVNLADSTSNEWYVTGVQLEAGTTASDFEFLPYDVNLQRCQRYYYKRLSENAYGPGSQGMQIGSSNVMIQGYHPVVMRSAPSMSGSNWSIEYSGSSAAWSMGSTRTSTTAWSSENSLSGTDGNAAILYANNNTAADITGDSEL